MGTKPDMKMPELLVFAKPLTIGFVGAEVLRTAFYLGANFAPILSEVALWVITVVILIITLLCLTYAQKRGALVTAARMGRSHRLDLLTVIGVGIWINMLASPGLTHVHEVLKSADPFWAPAVLLLFCALLSSPLIRQYWPRSKRATSQLYFIADEEIGDKKEDLFASDSQAKSFAETVLASGAHPGLIFGIDGPWGIGKTSFINLAERFWELAEDRVIVCRFEPLRYASETDLADRLIRDVTATIQRKVFAPEFRPAASRYSRLIKGKADISFLGFKLSLEPSQETVDELLDDIDEVLRRIDRRVIIVIDDLDRLDAKTTNNVLFATRRTFKLSQATYVLCYDTEILARSNDESSRAREFLEKFVTVKMSLFVDSSRIRDFLRSDWQAAETQFGSIPSDTMMKLGAVLNELSDILGGELAAQYLPLVGDLRKVKRFVNAMLLMQIEKSNLGRTDFNKRDLINLILLHLYYPGLFRFVYAEETEGRGGTFSLLHEYGEPNFKNSSKFSEIMNGHQGAAGFLLKQLFDVATLELGNRDNVEESTLVSRACFNHGRFRNLEGYLKLIVRFTTPEPQETFVLYQEAVERVRKGSSVESVLKSPDFNLERGDYAHDQFWRVLVNQSYTFTHAVAEDAIDTLIDYLPRYSAISNDDRGLRQRSIYSLVRLLDSAGWGRTSGRRRPNTAENVLEIAWRIFGEKSHQGKGLLQLLSDSSRGVLGWNDLMSFRLNCSADRQGQLHNLHRALIIHQDRNSETTGLVSNLALKGMRKLSQEVFALFEQAYIYPRINFLAEVNNTPNKAFLGEALPSLDHAGQADSINQRITSIRSAVKTFVIYQLSNSLPPKGAGVGCGYYDASGTNDGGGIARKMNEYMFDHCFNPDIHEDNAFHFLDYCLSNLSNSFFSDEEDEDGYIATKTGLPSGLDPMEMGRYWIQHQERIRQRVLHTEERQIITSTYIASYSKDLNGVFAVLDELARESQEILSSPDKLSPESNHADADPR